MGESETDKEGKGGTYGREGGQATRGDEAEVFTSNDDRRCTSDEGGSL